MAGSLAERVAAVMLAFGPALPIGLLLASISDRRATPELANLALPMGVFALLAALCGILLQPLIHSVPAGIGRAAADSFLGAGLPEESAKLAILLAVVLRNDEVVRSRDAIFAGAWLGLGFALMENFFYVAGDGQWLTIAALRAVTAVPEHVALGLILGFFLTRTRLGGWAPLAGLGVASLLHGLYDLPLAMIDVDPLEGGMLAWAAASIGAVLAAALLVAGPVARSIRALPLAQRSRFENGARLRRIAGLTAWAVGTVGVLLMAAGVAAIGWDRRFVLLGQLGVLPVAFAVLWFRGRPSAAAASVAIAWQRVFPRLSG